MAATTFALTSCGDDETIIDEPDVPVTPENPDEEEPETPATTYAVSVYDLNNSSGNLIAGGDSIAFFALVDEILGTVQDSLTNAESTMYIEIEEDHSFALIAEGANKEEFDALDNSLRARLFYLGDEPCGFVYTGLCRYGSQSTTSLENIFGNMSSITKRSISIVIPRLQIASWTTTAENAPVQSITFSRSTEAYVDGNQDASFSVYREGGQFTLKGVDNTYVLQINAAGTELTLISINGEEVSETYVYTVETPAE